MAATSWLDRVGETLAPHWHLRRLRARLAAGLIQRHYEAAGSGRRTQGWHRNTTDANAATGPFVRRLRDSARDLVRNNPYAESALATIVDHTVGWGIVAKPKPRSKKVDALWKSWADTTACDADGRTDFAGLQKLVMRTVAESGEVLVRRRLRRPEDGLPIPLQLQVLEPDFLDTARDQVILGNGGRITQGIETDAIGRRVAYYLFPEHPGSVYGTVGASVRVPAEGVLHIFRGQRPGQLRGVTWFAPVLLRFRDFDEFEDATLMKQKIAACLSVITSDADGTGAPLGATDANSPEIDSLEPGMILNVPPGRSVDVVQPPNVTEYPAFSQTMLRSIATGLGITYEDLTGDYNGLPFSAARMSRLRHWARVDDWRWRLMIPQFCDPAWRWAMEAAAIMGLAEAAEAEWTAPPMPMLEPDKEGLAYQRNIRTGIMTLSEAIRERGYEPEELLQEMAADWKRLDALGLILDSDPRVMNQAGQLQGAGLPDVPAVPAELTTPVKAVDETQADRMFDAIFRACSAVRPNDGEFLARQLDVFMRRVEREFESRQLRSDPPAQITINVPPAPEPQAAPPAAPAPEPIIIREQVPLVVEHLREVVERVVEAPPRLVNKEILRDEHGRIVGVRETEPDKPTAVVERTVVRDDHGQITGVVEAAKTEEG